MEAPSLIFGDCQKIVNVSQKIVTQTSQPRLLLSLWSRGFCQNFCSKKFGTGSPKKRKHAENEPLSFRMFNCSIISCNCEFSIAETLRRLRDLDLKLKICNFFPTNLLSQMQGWPPLPQSTNSIVSMAKTIGSPKNSAGSPRFLGAQPNHFPYEGGCNLITHNLENRNINLSKFLVVVLYIRTAPFRFSVFCSCNSLSFAQKQNKPLSL